MSLTWKWVRRHQYRITFEEAEIECRPLQKRRDFFAISQKPSVRSYSTVTFERKNALLEFVANCIKSASANERRRALDTSYWFWYRNSGISGSTLVSVLLFGLQKGSHFSRIGFLCFLSVITRLNMKQAGME